MSLEKQLYRKLASSETYKANDRLLIIQQWRDEGLELTPHQEQQFMTVSSPESIRRTRQRLQEKHAELRPSQQVQRLRRKRSIQVRDAVRESKTPIIQTMFDVPQAKQDIWSTL